jgi:hypothetical protein
MDELHHRCRRGGPDSEAAQRKHSPVKTKRSGISNVFRWYKQGEVNEENINSILGKGGENVL